MIDIHSHILSNLDDGPSSEEGSLLMAKLAAEEGIRTIIATPHHKNGRFENEKESIIHKICTLQTLLDEKKIDIKIVPGQEIRLYGEIVEDYVNNRLLPLDGEGGKYLLIELPTNHLPHFTETLLFELQLQGVIPVIAHPERNAVFIENPEKLYKFVLHGAVTQVTTSSIVGNFGKKIQNFSHQLIEHNLTHIIASDAHNTASRSFCMKEALNVVSIKYGHEKTLMYENNSEAIVRGENLMREIPSLPSSKGIWRTLFRL